MEGYGLMEIFFVIYVNFFWKERILGSIGVFWSDIDVKIFLFEIGKEVVVSEVGEIVVKGF